jgi:integrase
MCRCSPRVRAQVKRRWVAEGVFPEGWTSENLRQFEAEAIVTREGHESGRRVIERVEAPLLSELADAYLVNLTLRAELDEVSEGTLRTRRSQWNTLKPLVGAVRVDEFGVDDVRELELHHRAKGYEPTTIEAHLTCLSSILNEQAVPRWLPVSPTAVRGRGRGRGGRQRQPRRKPRSLEVAFVFELLDAAARQDDGLVLHDMILCGATTGMRKREIAGLRPEHVDLRKRRIEVEGQIIVGNKFKPPKSYEPRTTVLCDALAERLSVRLDHAAEYVFTPPGAAMPWTDTYQGDLFKDVWEGCGSRRKGDGWHALRHTFATLLDAGRCRPLAIDAVMGHKNQGVNFRYRHVLDPDLDEMVRVLNECFDRTPPEVTRLDERRRLRAVG